MTTIKVHSSAIRGLVREVTSRDGELDTSYTCPEIEGSSTVLDEYCEVLSVLLGLVERYSGLVSQDSAMVESIVAEMEAADETISSSLSRLFATFPSQAG